MGNRPLLFVKAPPAFFIDINSDSTPVLEDAIEEAFVDGIVEAETEQVESIEPVESVEPFIEDAEVRRKTERLKFLSAPFQQKAYQPLQFSLSDGRIIEGIVDRVMQDEVILKSYTGVVYPTKINELVQIKWRGKVF
ncbi:hypothetical protein [Viridibacillus arvi]|uniref:hypothetical protein n=1 Tax=Viridibacillus arvi TaxID=263475 RepID=UPI00187B28AC|nr:hypothetical protein [Viridibacillus sp. JNUCC-6]QOV10579.1 hypothetical protein JNUCC6_18675 [Viridibacillus sp. JNUCC-6]